MTDKSIPASGHRGRRGRPEMIPVKRVAEALRAARGIQRFVAQKLGCHRNTVANMVKRHDALAEIVDEEREGLLDTAEAKLVEAISRGEMTAILFYLKTQGKRRGYVERQSAELIQLTPEMLDKMTPEQLRSVAAGEPVMVALAKGNAGQGQ